MQARTWYDDRDDRASEYHKLHEAADDLPGCADGGVAVAVDDVDGFFERCMRSNSAAASRLTDVRSANSTTSGDIMRLKTSSNARAGILVIEHCLTFLF